MNDEALPAAEADARDRQVLVSQLNNVYDAASTSYTLYAQGAAILLSAWGVVLAVGIGGEHQSGLAVIASAACLLVLAYHMNRIGQSLAACMITAARIEKELQLADDFSLSHNLLISMRGRDLARLIEDLALNYSDDEFEDALSQSSEYSFFSLRNSKSAVFLLLFGTSQLLLALYLVLNGVLPII